MKVTFLGTGPSLGTPIIGCNCDVCKSNDPKDKRLRSSVLIEINDKIIVIDAGPDFREQMLKYNNSGRLDAVILTHPHRDHTAGLDDVRPYNFFQHKPIDIYAEKNVIEDLKKHFFYSFTNNLNKGVPEFNIFEISTEPFFIDGIKIIPVRIFHNLPILGFRIDDFTYITDAKTVSDDELKKAKGTKTLVVNALRFKEHPYHFNLQEALDFIDKIKPEKAYLTHMSHRIGKHSDLEKILPENVYPAYDGLVIS